MNDVRKLLTWEITALVMTVGIFLTIQAVSNVSGTEAAFFTTVVTFIVVFINTCEEDDMPVVSAAAEVSCSAAAFGAAVSCSETAYTNYAPISTLVAFVILLSVIVAVMKLRCKFFFVLMTCLIQTTSVFFALRMNNATGIIIATSGVVILILLRSFGKSLALRKPASPA